MNDRKGFGSNFGFLMAAVGSAVGLGNIWGFPNKMGANGGFPFLILYLALALCCGVIIMLGELALGRKTGHGAVGAYQSISKRFKWLGWLGIAAAALIFSFYSALGGYCLRYVVVNFGNLIGAEFGTNGVGGADVFQGLLSQPDVSIAFALAFMLITMLVVMSGVGGGIERVCSVGMPALFFILIICIIRSCTLPGAADGLKYMFVPGWAVANGIIDEAPGFWRVLTAAGGQMFFSLSLGAGVMITYGSYVKKDVNLSRSLSQIELFDTGVAFLAGLMIIPAVFVFSGMDGMSSGPSLMFVSLPKVFASMGVAGPVIGLVFFVMVAFAALTSCISIMETLVANCMEIFHQSRKAMSLTVGVLATAAAVVVCLGYNVFYFELTLPSGATAQILDLMDYISNSFLMPFISFLTCIFVGWVIKPQWIIEEMEASGHTFGRKKLYAFMIRYVTPVIMAVLFLQSAGVFNLVQELF